MLQQGSGSKVIIPWYAITHTTGDYERTDHTEEVLRSSVSVFIFFFVRVRSFLRDRGVVTAITLHGRPARTAKARR